MENIRRYFKRTDKTYLLLCIFSSVMAVTALSSWAAKQGNGFAVDEITGQITGLGDYRRPGFRLCCNNGPAGPVLFFADSTALP